MLPKENKLDPRVKRTRQLLEQSFRELLEEKGFQSVTVQDITDRATVNRATFYAHFEDKYAILDHVIRESFQQMLQSKLSPDSEFSLDNLQLLVITVCEYLEQFNSHHCGSSVKQFEPLMEKEVQTQIYHLILRWIKQLKADKVKRLASPEVVASMISWAIFGAGLHWSQNGSIQSAEEIAKQVLSLITEGLSGSFSPVFNSAHLSGQVPPQKDGVVGAEPAQ
jgi:AcrR family transcriptional regulator